VPMAFHVNARPLPAVGLGPVCSAFWWLWRVWGQRAYSLRVVRHSVGRKGRLVGALVFQHSEEAALPPAGCLGFGVVRRTARADHDLVRRQFPCGGARASAQQQRLPIIPSAKRTPRRPHRPPGTVIVARASRRGRRERPRGHSVRRPHITSCAYGPARAAAADDLQATILRRCLQRRQLRSQPPGPASVFRLGGGMRAVRLPAPLAAPFSRR